jgi:hypothetical protein
MLVILKGWTQEQAFKYIETGRVGYAPRVHLTDDDFKRIERLSKVYSPADVAAMYGMTLKTFHNRRGEWRRKNCGK